MVDLHDLGLGRIERPIREIAAQQKQRVARHHRVIAGAEADQAGHADVVRIVVFDKRLAAQRVDNRGAERVGQRNHFVMRSRHAAAAHDRHGFASVKHTRKPLEIGLRGHDGGGFTGTPARRFGGPFTQRYIAGQHDHGHAALLDGGAHRALQHARKLRRVGDQFDEVAALLEQVLRMGFLKVAEADFRRRNMCGDRQHRLMIAVAIEQPVDQMQIAGAAATGADSELAGRGGVCARCECSDFFVTRMHPADRAELVEAVRQSVETVASHAPDALDARGCERFRQIVGDGVAGHKLLLDDRVDRAVRINPRA